MECQVEKNCDSIFGSFCSIKTYLKNQTNLDNFYNLFIFANVQRHQTAILFALLFDEY